MENLVWDVTVVCQLANSYVASAAREAGSVAELAASKKMDKYTSLAADYHFQPIAVEMLGPINKSASDFLTVLAQKNKPTFWRRAGDCLFISAHFCFVAAIQQHSASRFVCL